jgi:hypothetical protein
MDRKFIDQQLNDPELLPGLFKPAYIADKSSILAIDLEILMALFQNNPPRSFYQAYRKSLNA